METLARLDRTVEAFAAFCAALPPALPRPQAWGPREVLSHIVFWHEAYVEIIDAQLRGRRPPYLEGAFPQLNALAVASMIDVPVRELVARQRRLHIAV